MRFGIYIYTICAVAAFLFSGNYGLNSYFKSRQLEVEAENLAVRTRMIKRQVSELEQKARILKRVGHFVKSAQDKGLTAENWSAYDVHIQEAMDYQELAQIVEQCIHNNDLYFKPISFHVAVGQNEESPKNAFDDVETVPVNADDQGDTSADVALALKGTFMVRH